MWLNKSTMSETVGRDLTVKEELAQVEGAKMQRFSPGSQRQFCLNDRIRQVKADFIRSDATDALQ